MINEESKIIDLIKILDEELKIIRTSISNIKKSLVIEEDNLVYLKIKKEQLEEDLRILRNKIGKQ